MHEMLLVLAVIWDSQNNVCNLNPHFNYFNVRTWIESNSAVQEI